MISHTICVVPCSSPSGNSGYMHNLTLCELICCISSQISSMDIFLIGAIAKAIATTATYPLQTVQAILRVTHSLSYS